WVGLILVNVGGFEIRNCTALEVEPPGLSTVTLTTAGDARSAAGTGAVRVELFTKVVASRGFPKRIWLLVASCRVALLTNARPLTVRVNPADPTVAPGGINELMDGALTENGTPFET